jgi:hypothetical protein
VQAQDAGVASAMVNTSQQVGGSIGTALLNTVAADATAGWLLRQRAAGGAPTADLLNRAAVHGYATAAWWAAAILVFSSVVAFSLLSAGRPEPVKIGEGVTGAEQEAALPTLVH